MKHFANSKSLCLLALGWAIALLPPGFAADDQVLELARVHYYKREYRKAQQEFTEAIKHNPRQSFIYEERAKCLEKLGLNTEALSDYSAALQLSPNSGRLWLRYAYKLQEMESLDAAVKAFEKAIALHVEDTGAVYRDMAGILSETGKRRECIAAYKQAYLLLKSTDDRYDILRRLADNYMAVKQPKEAIAEMTRAIALRPDSEQGYRARARLYNEQKEYDKAIADISQGLKCRINKNERAVDLRMRARLYEVSGQTEKAIGDLSELFRLFPNQTSALFDRAKLYDKINKHDLANRDRALVREIDARAASSY